MAFTDVQHGNSYCHSHTLDHIISRPAGRVVQCTNILDSLILKGRRFKLFQDRISRYPEVVSPSGTVAAFVDVMPVQEAAEHCETVTRYTRFGAPGVAEVARVGSRAHRRG